MEKGGHSITGTADCACGAFTLRAQREPAMVDACCCLQGQKRTGSLFGAAAYFPKNNVQIVSGPSKTFTRTGESGVSADLYFCPSCGSTGFCEAWVYPDIRDVAVGCFGDSSFSPLQLAGWDSRRHEWMDFPPNVKVVKPQLTQ